VELSAFSRLLIKVVGLVVIVITLNRLPGNLFEFVVGSFPAATRVLLGGLLFVPALISLAIGMTLVYGAEGMVARAFGQDSAEPSRSGTIETLEAISIALVGVYILVISLSEVSYFLFKSYSLHLQDAQGHFPQGVPNMFSTSVLIAFALRAGLALLLILGRHNAVRLHRRIVAHRPMKDLRDE
jgi:hypothetical protein